MENDVLGASPSLGDRNFRAPRDNETKRQRNVLCFLPNIKPSLAVTGPAFHPRPEGQRTHWSIRGGEGEADIRMARFAHAFQTNLCRFGWATFPARGKNIQGLFPVFFPGTKLVDLLRNLITTPFHGEIQLQPLQQWKPILLIQKETKQRGFRLWDVSVFCFLS